MLVDGDGLFRIVFVCTGNICRSPTAETLMRARVLAAGAQESIPVASAGLGTQPGWLMDRTVAGLMEERGLHGTESFRSRPLADPIVHEADLLLTGTRDHRMQIGRSWPPAYARTFTLRECAFLLDAMPNDVLHGLARGAAERGRGMLRWLQSERGLVTVPRGDLDIADPIGRRPKAYRRMVDEVSAAVDTLAGVLLAPSAVTPS